VCNGGEWPLKEKRAIEPELIESSALAMAMQGHNAA